MQVVVAYWVFSQVITQYRCHDCGGSPTPLFHNKNTSFARDRNIYALGSLFLMVPSLNSWSPKELG